jgi:hypothetical protein
MVIVKHMQSEGGFWVIRAYVSNVFLVSRT